MTEVVSPPAFKVQGIGKFRSNRVGAETKLLLLIAELTNEVTKFDITRKTIAAALKPVIKALKKPFLP